MKLLKIIRVEILLPQLAVTYPLLHLYASNFGEVGITSVIKPFAIIALFVFLSYKFLQIFIKDKLKISLIMTLLITVGLSFGYMADLVPYFELFKIKSFVLGKNKLLFLIIFFASSIILWKILKIKKVSILILNYLAMLIILAIILTLIKIPLYYSNVKFLQNDSVNNLNNDFNPANSDTRPDIYYILLDGHARKDVLEEIYGYDNNYLTLYLKSKNFYVAEESRSNYIYTYASLASSLNNNYLENLIGSFGKKEIDISVFDELIKNNLVSQNLKKLGYVYYTFRSGFASFNNNPYAANHFEYSFGLNNYERNLVNKSIFGFLLNLANIDIKELHRKRVLFTFETLKEISNDSQPTFTFAHIISPHPPFVFNRDGSSASKGKEYNFVDGARFSGTKEEYKAGYLNQLIYIDKKLAETLEAILKNSDQEPIIIIQGDHGPAYEADWSNKDNKVTTEELIDVDNPLSIKERTSILNAYYFPQKDYSNLYQTITPVNSFRMIFNTYFGQSFEILEDKTILN
ncbi:MAG TPA: sulfatase-like hydrolase/transferase [Patescibacteria group bacterium]